VDIHPRSQLHKNSNQSDNLSNRFLSETKNLTGLVLEDASRQLDRNILLKQHENVVQALEDLWVGVENGEIRVECMPLLRSARDVSCPELSRKLQASELDHTKVIRDLKLLVNTFTYVIKPKSIKFTL